MLYCCTELKILFNIGRKLDVCHSYVRVLFMYLAWPPVVNFETSRSTTILKPLNICCYSGVFYCWLLGNQGKVRKCRDYFSKRKIFCSQVRFVSCARCLFVYVSLPLFFCFVHVRTLIMFNRTCMSGHEYTSSQIFFLSLHEKVEKHVCTFNLHVWTWLVITKGSILHIETRGVKFNPVQSFFLCLSLRFDIDFTCKSPYSMANFPRHILPPKHKRSSL